MRLAVCVLLACLFAACGSETAEPVSESPLRSKAEAEAGAENGPPRIASVEIFPDDPTVDQTLSLAIQVSDPERDALDIEVEWWRNGAPYKVGSETHLAGRELARGDEIYALVTASDGAVEVSAESASVTIRNQAPRMTKLELLPEKPTGEDSLMVVAEALDPEGDDISFAYRWYRNDQPIGGEEGPGLQAAHVRRSDEIRVEVQVRDDQGTGNWISSPPKKVRNASPVITSKPSYEMAEPGKYTYEVVAEDPDGDQPLRYELAKGPDGMKLDLLTGRLQWEVPPDTWGQYTIELNVHDAHGGVSRQRYAIDLRWEEPESPPAAPAADQDANDPNADELDQALEETADDPAEERADGDPDEEAGLNPVTP